MNRRVYGPLQADIAKDASLQWALDESPAQQAAITATAIAGASGTVVFTPEVSYNGGANWQTAFYTFDTTTSNVGTLSLVTTTANASVYVRKLDLSNATNVRLRMSTVAGASGSVRATFSIESQPGA